MVLVVPRKFSADLGHKAYFQIEARGNGGPPDIHDSVDISALKVLAVSGTRSEAKETG